jgi:hypothetical protein
VWAHWRPKFDLRSKDNVEQLFEELLMSAFGAQKEQALIGALRDNEPGTGQSSNQRNLCSPLL